MKKPDCIFFDFGGTLFDDGPFDAFSGMDALRRAALNPDAISTEKLVELYYEVETRTNNGISRESYTSVDIAVCANLRLTLARAGLHYELPIHELETIFDRHNSERTPVAGIEDLIAAMKETGVRSAVISNTGFSCGGMDRAIKEGLPSSAFEFVVTSSDYIFPKPTPDMFFAAANLARVLPENCFYCGNDHEPDVLGSTGAGMYPFIIDVKLQTPSAEKAYKGKAYTAVRDWTVLADMLRSL